MATFWTMFKQSKFIQLCLGIAYFSSGLLINTLQFLLFILVKPFSKTMYRTVLYYLCYSFHCQLVFIADWWSGSKLKIYISKEDLERSGTEHSLLIMNHTYDADWLFGWMFCDKVNVLGNCKAYAKKVIQYIPTVGWSWKFAEFVFLERSFDKDRDIIKKQLNEIFDYPDPVWLLLNAEGTRFTPSKHEASVKFAEERGMYVLKHHLIPRTKGFTASLSVLKQKCPAIMDVQLVFDKDDKIKPTISNLLSGRSITGHMYVRRIAMTDVPDDEEQAAKFLQDLYIRKDKLQDSFHTHGDFFKTSGVPPIDPIIIEPRLSSLFNTIFWIVMTVIPIVYFLMSLLLTGNILYLSIAIGIIFAFYLLMHKSIGMSKISKASSYGATTNGNSQHKH